VTGGRPPAGLAIPALLAVAMVALPLLGLLLRAPWSDLGSILLAPDVGQALLLSAECSIGMDPGPGQLPRSPGG